MGTSLTDAVKWVCGATFGSIVNAAGEPLGLLFGSGVPRDEGPVELYMLVVLSNVERTDLQTKEMVHFKNLFILICIALT